MTPEPHVRFALWTIESQDVPPVYRVTCTCGWQSGWTKSWRSALSNHSYRLQCKKAAA